jgi:hypothetical protein
MIASKMKSTLNTHYTDNQIESITRFSFGLMLAGIVTAILCVLTFLYDTYLTGSELFPLFFESSSTSSISELVASASTLISSIGDTVILMTNFYN